MSIKKKEKQNTSGSNVLPWLRTLGQDQHTHTGTVMPWRKGQVWWCVEAAMDSFSSCNKPVHFPYHLEKYFHPPFLFMLKREHAELPVHLCRCFCSYMALWSVNPRDK